MDPEHPIVCKFGGSSLADASQVRKVAAILDADPRRQFIVPSAPGRRFAGDEKITDLLYLCHELALAGDSFQRPFDQIRDRYCGMARELGVAIAIEAEIETVRRQIQFGASRDLVASRGEYVIGRILAAYLGARFVDPIDAIRIAPDGCVCASSYDRLAGLLHGAERVVLPGFYGRDEHGRLRTLARGGSDLTGAVVARAAQASLYENWTDVSGLLTADPRVVAQARPIHEITYEELRALTQMGATVLHGETVLPVRDLGIPIHIRNTNAPAAPGTRTVMRRGASICAVTGIAGLKQDVASVLQADRLDATSGLSLITLVGQGIAGQIGLAARAVRALGGWGIPSRFLDHGSSGVSLSIGVATADFDKAMRALHAEFLEAGRLPLRCESRRDAPDRPKVAPFRLRLASEPSRPAPAMALAARTGP